MLEMPVERQNVAQEYLKRPIVSDQALVEEPWMPVEEDVADVEDDGARPLCHALLALAGLEAAIGLVDDVGAATATDHAIVAMPALERLERVANLHGRERPPA
jgi:hypothetical protein